MPFENYSPNNPQENPRKREPYIRLLELMSVISEEWGESIQEINNYLWKSPSDGHRLFYMEEALKELQQIQSPLEELKGLISVEIVKLQNSVNK